MLIIVALMLAAPAMAHQLKASVTTVLFNQRTHNIELMHRFYLHDTEHAVEHLFPGNADILSNKADQQRFADYVASHIALQTLNGKPLSLSDVGAQVDGKFFWVYQEAPIPEGIKGIRMSNGALRNRLHQGYVLSTAFSLQLCYVQQIMKWVYLLQCRVDD